MAHNDVRIRKDKIIFLIILIIYFSILALVVPPVFETNDDRTIMNIISGQYGEEYSAYAIFIGYPLSYILSKLYMLIPAISWYGLFFCGTIVFSAWVIIGDFLKKIRENGKNNLLYIGISINLLIIYTNMFIVQQFTVISAILIATAIYKILRKDSWTGIIILCILSYETRSDVFVMSIPFLIAAGIWNGMDGKIHMGIIIRNCLPLLGVILSIIAVGKVTNEIAYSSSEWKGYNSYHKERVSLYDYTDYMGNDKYKEMCLDEGISKKDYYITNTYNLLLDNSITPHKMKKIENIVSKTRKDNIIVKVLKVIYYDILNCLGNYWKYTILTLLMDIAVICILMRNNNTGKKLVWVCLVFGKYVIISYFVWMSRLPNRVYLALFIISLVLDIYILREGTLRCRKYIKQICVVISIVICLLLTRSNVENYKYINVKNKEYKKVNEYCQQHTENKYLLAINYVWDCTAKSLENNKEYMFYLEPWLARSPMVKSYLTKNKCGDFGSMLLKKRTFYIVYKSYDIKEMSEYMKERFGNIKLEKIDNIDQKYFIYHFYKK